MCTQKPPSVALAARKSLLLYGTRNEPMRQLLVRLRDSRAGLLRVWLFQGWTRA